MDGDGWRCHDEGVSSDKKALIHVTIPGGKPGQTKDLIPTYEIMHRIYRETIAPHVGNWDQVHGYVFDLLKLTREKNGSKEKLDVMDFIYNEMWLAMLDQRAPVYGPYLMKLICAKWAAAKEGEDLMDGLKLTKHLVKRLRVNTHKPIVETGGPSGPSGASGPSGPIGSSGAPFMGSSMDEPS